MSPGSGTEPYPAALPEFPTTHHNTLRYWFLQLFPEGRGLRLTCERMKLPNGAVQTHKILRAEGFAALKNGSGACIGTAHFVFFCLCQGENI
jgi:hypothetical protein